MHGDPMLVAIDLVLEICSLSVVVLHETLRVPVIMYGSETCYGKRRKDLELGLYRWTTSGDC